MHELSIAESMLETVGERCRERGLSRLRSISLRVGLLSAVDSEALQFAFEALTEGGPYDGAQLRIERTFPLANCDCGRSFPVEELLYACPGCGAVSVRLSGGDELDIIQIEAE